MDSVQTATHPRTVHLEDMVSALTAARLATADAQARVDALRAAHPEIFAEVEACESARRAATSLEKDLRALANDALAAGVPLPPEFNQKPVKTCIYHEEHLLRWAVEHQMYPLLNLNCKLLEEAAIKVPQILGAVRQFDDPGDGRKAYAIRLDDNGAQMVVDTIQQAIIPKDLPQVEPATETDPA